MSGQKLGVPTKPRSTRTPKPDVQPSASSGSGAKSRLADGARSCPGSAPKTSSKGSKQQAPPNRSGGSPASTKTNGGKDNEQKNNVNQNEGQTKQGSAGNNPSDKANQSGNSSGLANKAKNLSSNATGVDYSDKSMKDQLEHQAADVAMDATPGLSQFNSARKALKQANAEKRKAKGPNAEKDIADKAEDVMDGAVDKGIKSAKMIAGLGAAKSAGMLGMATAMLMNALMMLKGMIMAIAGKIAGFIGSIFSAVSSFVSGVLGVTAAVGNAIAAGFTALVVGAVSVLGFGVSQELKKDDSSLDCVPYMTTVPERTQEYILDGEHELIRQENAVKLWSVYSVLGASKEQTAAVLGNLMAESQLDPTAVETIYTEPFSIGSRKQKAISVDFNVGQIDASYSARFPAIKYVGIGLGQWTNERNRLLVNYAKDRNLNWYEFDTQIKFMFEGDYDYRQKQLKDFLSATPGNVEAETERFMNTWIGLSSPNPSLSKRKTNATGFMFTLERATADTAYAESILSGLNVNRSAGNSAAGAFHQDDGCGQPVKTHYGNGAADGTGEVPAGLALVPWSRETLPESLRQFAKNPEDAGLAWGNSTGWAPGVIPNQCAALSHSLMMLLYPDWNQGGKPTTRPFADGKDVADKWAQHWGESAVNYPSGGAVFSDSTTSQWGHTGIVQHVFANGDILIVEQNIRGVSGEGAGLNYSWSWRVIKKDRYTQEGWKFFKPANAQPQWTRTTL